MTKWVIPPREVGLATATRTARSGQLVSADVALSLVGRANAALARRQRMLVGTGAQYAAGDVGASAEVLYRFAFRTSSTVRQLVARYVIGPRETHEVDDPAATLVLKTRIDGDGGTWQSHPTVTQAASGTSWVPGTVSIVEQPIVKVGVGDDLFSQDVEGRIEVTDGFNLLGFSISEQTRSSLTASAEAVLSAYSQPGGPLRTDPIADVWTQIDSLWQYHGGPLAWWLAPFGSSVTAASWENVVDGSADGYTAPGIRAKLPSLERLGVTTAPVTVWVVSSGVEENGVSWRIRQTTSGGTTATIAAGSHAYLAGAATLTRTKDVALTPHTGMCNYQLQLETNGLVWGWGMYLEGK